jgi:spore photoproduct lyase
MKRFFPKKIIVDPSVRDERLTRRVLDRCPGVPVEEPDTADWPDDLQRGKNTLFITRNRGEFVKPCPATPRYLCCDYRILDFCGHCAMDCTYCVLQSYLASPVLTLYANLDSMQERLRGFFRENRQGRFRIGTGEFTDSLVLEHLTGFHAEIIPFFREEKRAVLEIKTKTDNIEDLLSVDPGGKVIVAWSLNPPDVTRTEEFRVANLEERLEAARRCQEAGYVLAFHFDPVIRFPGWEEAYSAVVRRLFETVDPNRVAYISLGCIRFMPALKPVVEERFPHTNILYEEFIRGEDGKMRYLKPVRIEMYRRMVSWIRRRAPNVVVYFCMERRDVWERVFGFSPRDREELNEILLAGWEQATVGLEQGGAVQ